MEEKKIKLENPKWILLPGKILHVEIILMLKKKNKKKKSWF